MGIIVTEECSNLGIIRTKVHLALSVGNMVMFWSLLRGLTAFFSCIMRSDTEILALEEVAETFILHSRNLKLLSFQAP